MQPNEKPKLIELLTTTMAAYSKPLPEAAIVKVWIELLSPFPMIVINAAFDAYRAEESRFAPNPAAVENLCRTMDGRPSADEAWSAVLLGLDAQETVVWTEEMQQAKTIADPVISTGRGDLIGGRKTFIEAYNRLVADARAQKRPARWSVSPGNDKAKLARVVHAAIAQGRLPETQAIALQLPAPDEQGGQVAQLGYDGDAQEESYRSGMAMVKEAIAKLIPPSVKAEQRRQAERDAEQAKKREINERVRHYTHAECA